MNRISIDVTPEEHQKIQAVAAQSGKSIQQFVLDRALAEDTSTNQAMAVLEEFLAPRIEEARTGQFSTRSPQDILQAVRSPN